MDPLTEQQQFHIIDNFVRKCAKCKAPLQPTSSMCVMCREQNPMPKLIEGSYVEHFEIKRCEKADDTTFWYCVHPKADSKLEELLTFCVHCITVELIQKDLVIIKDNRMQWKTEQQKPGSTS